ncbi:bifunctional 3-(3-hydroxy-phenyl)propionate/3-hydroxycinnamic acid hydroxylase [uncultured Sphingomonas sp.]|uniref:bifunctional 3-(3-hydroxy-phenyl)propionate/3-hydroxycinnamic acid hydroxylase n=1 Tax=uncultured Sphingomonas sp. TaxID=158754 RepID=UPI0035C9ABD2
MTVDGLAPGAAPPGAGPAEGSGVDHRVVIVGAGPTGLVLANLLGAAGIDTLLVEANDATVGEPRAVSIDDESLRTVQALGLLDRVGAGVVGGYGSEYRSPRGRVFLRVKPRTQPYGHPRRNAFRQPVFEAQLREGLARFPCVTTLFRCTLERFEDARGRVSIRLRRADGEDLTVHADFLVGCDGARSGVREALGARLVGDTADERWLIIDLVNSPAPSPETIVYCDARRPGIALPGPDRTRRYEFKVLPGEDEATLLADENLTRLVRAHGAAPGSEVVRKTVYRFHARIADVWGRGRVWLAGDAAHLSPPFAGQGMNSGIRDAANLGWKLTAIVQGRLGPRLLDTYPAERRAHVGEMIRLARRMGAIMGPRTRGHGALHRAAFGLLSRWPAARTWFAEMRYKPPPRFEDGFVAGTMPSRRGVVGRMLPQPRLRGGPQAGALLDELLGGDFVLLGVGLDQRSVDAVALGAGWTALLGRRVAVATGWAPELADHAGMLLLLRPDRYVAARFAPGQVAAAVPELESLIARTWVEGGAS